MSAHLVHHRDATITNTRGHQATLIFREHLLIPPDEADPYLRELALGELARLGHRQPEHAPTELADTLT